VRGLAASGVDFLKVYNSIPRDAYFAIANEARAIGIPFTGHVPEAVSNGEASDAGQRSEEHLINMLLDCSTNAEALRAARVATMTSDKITGEARLRALAWPDPEGLFDTYSEEKAARLFAKFVKNGTWQTPTLAVLSGFAKEKDDEFVQDPRRRFLPRQWTDSWDPRATFFLRDLSEEDYAALDARIVALLARYKKLVGDMRKAGVEFLAGTDASGWNPVLPGFGLHEELALLVDSGLTPMEALQSATRNPARYFNKLDEWGTVEVKKSADLVLLNGDPLEDIRNTQKIEAVIMRGHYYSRKALDEMVKVLQ
jgi:imidazolonepropionase-like amidohydrolase